MNAKCSIFYIANREFNYAKVMYHKCGGRAPMRTRHPSALEDTMHKAQESAFEDIFLPTCKCTYLCDGIRFTLPDVYIVAMVATGVHEV